MLKTLTPTPSLLITYLQSKHWKQAQIRAITHPLETHPPTTSQQSSSSTGATTTTTTTTALSLAIRGDAPLFVLQTLLSSCPSQIDIIHIHRGSVLHEAMKHLRSHEVISFLVQEIAKRDSTETETKPKILGSLDDFCRCPLHYWVWRVWNEDCEGMMELMEVLLDGFPEAMYVKDLDGRTPLDLVVMAPSPSDDYDDDDDGMEDRIHTLVKLILKRYTASTTKTTQKRIIPLASALLHGRRDDTVELLLRAKDDEDDKKGLSNEKNPVRETYLHIAATMGASKCILSLLLQRYPQSIFAFDRWGLSPLDWIWIRHCLDHATNIVVPIKASKRRHIPANLSRLLQSTLRRIHNPSRPQPQDACFHKLWDRMELLLLSPPRRHWSIVHAAAAIPCPDAFLQWAVMRFPQQVELQNDNGKLPLHYAASSPWNHHIQRIPRGVVFERLEPLEIHPTPVSLLLQWYPQGAAIWDHQKRLPLHCAIDANRDDVGVVKELLKWNHDALEQRDGISKLYPFMLAAAKKKGEEDDGEDDSCCCLTTVYELLRQCPMLVESGIGG